MLTLKSDTHKFRALGHQRSLSALDLSSLQGPRDGSQLLGFPPQHYPQATAVKSSRGGNGCSLPCTSFPRHHHFLPPQQYQPHPTPWVRPPLVVATPHSLRAFQTLFHVVNRPFPSMSSGLLWIWCCPSLPT